ncbi:MAG: VanZ family protein [Methylocella sp.]
MREVARFIAWSLLVVITVLSLVPATWRPETSAPHNVEHLAIFCATGFAFGLAYGRRPFLVMAALVIFAGAIELAQLFTPDRHARLSDFIVDSLSLCAGVAVASVAVRTLRQST